MGEVKQHPWTTIAAMLSLAGVAVMFPQYLSASDVNNRITSIEQVQRQQIRETLLGRLGGLRSARFDLQLKIDAIRDQGQQPDPIFWNELKRLDNEIYAVEQQLK